MITLPLLLMIFSLQHDKILRNLVQMLLIVVYERLLILGDLKAFFLFCSFFGDKYYMID
jgi:hypothetical protein